jgi:hypothetical protein
MIKDLFGYVLVGINVECGFSKDGSLPGVDVVLEDGSGVQKRSKRVEKLRPILIAADTDN